MDIWFESLDNEGNEVHTIFKRASQRTQWEMARSGDREASERMLTGTCPTPRNTNGTVNPATGVWYGYSIPGMPASISGATFYPMVK